MILSKDKREIDRTIKPVEFSIKELEKRSS